VLLGELDHPLPWCRASLQLELHAASSDARLCASLLRTDVSRRRSAQAGEGGSDR